MKNKKILINLLLFSFCLLLFQANSQNNISSSNTTYQATSTYLLPVKAKVVGTAKSKAALPYTMATNITNLCDGSCTFIRAVFIETTTVTLASLQPVTYLWNNGSTGQMPLFCPTVTSIYTFTMTDKNGNSNYKVDSVLVNIVPPMDDLIPSFTSPSCYGKNDGFLSETGVGGTPPYDYLWSPTGATTQTLSGIPAGTYTVTVFDRYGCGLWQSLYLYDPPPINVTLITTSLTCNNDNSGEISANTSGAIGSSTYRWSNGVSGTSWIPGLSAGSYSVTATDANGCTGSASTFISEPPPLTLGVTSTSLSCGGNNNASATAIAGGGTAPYKYLWSNGATTAAVTGLSGSNYDITVRDKNGCLYTVTISISAGVVVQVVSTVSITCFGTCNGSATASGAGGASPYTYLWSNGVTDAVASPLCAGNYSVTITDFGGCTFVQSINIPQPSELIVSPNYTTPCEPDNATANAGESGGTLPYNYSWSPNGINASSITGLSTGTYTVIVTDGNMCTAMGTIDVISGTTLTAVVSASVTITLGLSTTLSASGGTSFQWSPAESLSCPTCQNPIASPSITTSYCVIISDGGNCTDTACVTVQVDLSCEPFVPTAFSPNGDNLNDQLCIQRGICTSPKFTIFNRWGEVVFETVSIPPVCWDGVLDNKQLDAGVFYYTFEGTNVDGVVLVQKGTITLVK